MLIVGLILILVASCTDNILVAAVLVVAGASICTGKYITEMKRTYKSGNFRKFSYEKHI